MAKPKTELTPNELENLAYQYLTECIEYRKEHPTASGKIVLLKERKIPTIDYFLRIWIPQQNKPTICRATYYRWLNNETNLNKCDTIKVIEGIFKALATDIVANDNKGVFYAKNKLGWTDKVQNEWSGLRIPIPDADKYYTSISQISKHLDPFKGRNI